MDLWKIYPLTIMENSTTITSICSNAYNIFLTGLSKNDINSIKMFDATAKLSSGILRGNVNQYGDFDECMELDEAQYCLAEIDIRPLWRKPFLKFKDHPKHRVPGFTMIRWGFCIPKECSNKDLENAIQEKLGIQSRIRPNMCQPAKKEPSAMTYGDLYAKLFFFVIVLAVNNICLKLLGCFSLQRNYKELTTSQKNCNEIQALHGIRALSALALIISHKVMALFYNPYINRSVMTEVNSY
ncbi:hypothetical protein NQ314_002544 [Rhamnusium bicolor]|uniref:Nose resistant-to-fluoxetine protein N-terminal domain-containing protein n=1 Tax=Rhamnusium bicolor TaxID=1586634 RepID=A0AAV8ZQN6_9CUCU|nr:hypothetical protein NQ314_002544 [Rhamnusium bicolor]